MSDYECSECGAGLDYPPNEFHGRDVCDSCYDRLDSLVSSTADRRRGV